MKIDPLDRMWRKMPKDLADCEMYKSVVILEDIDLDKLDKEQLPCITRRVFEEGNFEEAYDYIKKRHNPNPVNV